MGQDLQAGEMFGQRFRIIRVLGTGGMGKVYLAEHGVLRRMVAIKVLHDARAADAKAQGRFRREARAACRIEHQNVATVYDFGHDHEETPYLVMEYVEGPTIADVLHQQGPFAVERAAAILHQIAAGLGAAHTCRVIHRDLKPGNVALTPLPSGADQVKLMDFGLAKILDPEETTGLSATGGVLGTPVYMSPEQVAGQRVNHLTDLYSLGVMAFEMLVGRPPFDGALMEVLTGHIHQPPPSLAAMSRREDIPAALEQLVLRCLAKDPAHRPATGAAFRQDLAVAIAGAGPSLR